MPPWLTSAKEKAVDKKSSAATEQEGADEGGALPSNSPGTSPVEGAGLPTTENANGVVETKG